MHCFKAINNQCVVKFYPRLLIKTSRHMDHLDLLHCQKTSSTCGQTNETEMLTKVFQIIYLGSHQSIDGSRFTKLRLI
jgi:hypothetical protein